MTQETPVDRLVKLFADRLQPTRASRGDLKIKTGGTTNLAAALGVDAGVVSRWKSAGARGNHGRIPVKYNQAVVEACDAAGIPRSELVGILDNTGVCPCCGQPLQPGQFVQGVR